MNFLGLTALPGKQTMHKREVPFQAQFEFKDLLTGTI
jgi:hypothetical protein